MAAAARIELWEGIVTFLYFPTFAARWKRFFRLLRTGCLAPQVFIFSRGVWVERSLHKED